MNRRWSIGKKIIEHQAVGFRLADLATRLEAARQMVLHAAACKDDGRPCLTEASMAKLFASEISVNVCEEAIQVHGGYGYTKDYPPEKYWRDSKIGAIYEGTSNMQLQTIAKLIIGK